MKSLADVVSASGLEQYAEIALLIFFAVFVVITLRVMATRTDSLERASHLPLDDDTTPLATANANANANANVPGGTTRVER